MLIVHQQRAHQRVLYERFLECTATQQFSSRVVIPPQMELTPEQKAVIPMNPLKTMARCDGTDGCRGERHSLLCEQTEVGSIFEAIFELGPPEGTRQF